MVLACLSVCSSHQEALGWFWLSSPVTLDDVFSFSSHKPELPSMAPALLCQSALPLAGVHSPPGLPVSLPVSLWGLLARAGLNQGLRVSKSSTNYVTMGVYLGEVCRGLVQGHGDRHQEVTCWQ